MKIIEVNDIRGSNIKAGMQNDGDDHCIMVYMEAPMKGRISGIHDNDEDGEYHIHLVCSN